MAAWQWQPGNGSLASVGCLEGKASDEERKEASLDRTYLRIWRLAARVLQIVALLMFASLAIIGLEWHSQLSDSARVSMGLLLLSLALPLVPRFITVLQEKNRHRIR